MVFELLFEKFNKFYERIFYNYGLFISKYYVYAIVVSLVVNALLSIGIFKINVIKNTDELFMLSDSEAMKDEKYLKQLFNSTSEAANEFYLHQLFDFGSGGEINFHVRGNPKENILQKKYIDELAAIHRSIHDGVQIQYKNETFNFHDLCAKRNEKCWVEGAEVLNDRFLKFLKENSIKLRKAAKKADSVKRMSYDERLYFDTNNGQITELGIVLGKDFAYIIDDNDNLVANSDQTYAYSRVFKLRYQLKYNHETTDVKAKLWELEFLKLVRSLNTSLLAFTYGTSKSLEDEIAANITFDAILISVTFMLIIIFAILFMSINSNLITSPGVLLPLSGIASAMFGVSSAMGLLALLGYPACNLVYIIPFLVIGIGIDDMFLIYASFTRTNGKLETQQRISTALERVGVSITITSLTDFTAFIVGTLTGFKSVRIFCIYAAFSILFCYVYQLTLFSGFLVIHSKRIKANRNSLLWCIKYREEEADYSCEMHQMSKINSRDDDVYYPTTVKEGTSSFRLFLKSFGDILNSFYRFLITNNYGKGLVGVAFLVYISISVWNSFRIREGIDLADLVSQKSYFRNFTHDNLGLFDIEPVVMMVVYEPIDYTDRKVRAKITKLLNTARTIDAISQDFVLNWMSIFADELRQIAKHPENTDEILHKIAGTKSPFSNDIILAFNQTLNKTQIVASRFFIKYDRVLFNSKDAEPMFALQKLCSTSGLPVLPFGVTFKFYEQFEQTLPNIVQAFVVATEAMYLISLIFIPDLKSVVCIVVSMITIMLGLVGFMNVWNLSLSSITMIEVIMSVGFCIDFSAHITHAFIAGVGKGTRTERAYKACIKTGLPILQSAVSSIIGVCVLGFAESYIFQSFFKTMFIVMTLGLVTSMFFLPVLLSICGPHWKRHYSEIELEHRHEIKHESEIDQTTSNRLIE